jgi:hypothetical protein
MDEVRALKPLQNVNNTGLPHHQSIAFRKPALYNFQGARLQIERYYKSVFAGDSIFNLPLLIGIGGTAENNKIMAHRIPVAVFLLKQSRENQQIFTKQEKFGSNILNWIRAAVAFKNMKVPIRIMQKFVEHAILHPLGRCIVLGAKYNDLKIL